MLSTLGHLMRSNTLIEQFESRANSAESLDELASLFGACARELDVQHFLYVAADLPFAHSDEMFILSNTKTEWQAYYTESSAHLRDPVVRAGLQSVVFVDWAPQAQQENISKEQREFLQDASRYGLRYVAAVPLHGPCPARAVLCLLREQSNKESLEENLFDDFQLLGLKLHDAVRRLRFGDVEDDDPSDLTVRELECVSWSARGKTSWETAVILEVTEPTVNFHLTNAMRKLGSVTRPHAVARAVALGLISA